MDVLLERQVSGLCSVSQTYPIPTLLTTAEHLQARDFSELVTEVRQLQRRRVTIVSLRRQRAMRIGLQKLKTVLDDAGIRVCALGYSGGFTGALKLSYDDAVRDTRRALVTAAELGARCLIVAPGSRGLHTYNHADQVVRDGLCDCLDDALRLRIDMLLPLNTVFGNRSDVFRLRDCSGLDWVESFGSHRIHPMMVLRGATPWQRLPDCWKRCLRNGGMLRISPRCRKTLGGHNLISEMLSHLTNVAVPVS
ncbi:MAG: TIM barrel protein [Planctomycetaceae bacterium]|nr:TIM barrel protein [Planctomycetaceae bacterium]